MITISPEFGYVHATPFQFEISSDIVSSYDSFLWNFGDGNYTRVINPTHTYIYPKNYTVKLNAYKSDGTYDQFTINVNVLLYVNESIYFENVPPPTFASHYNKYPFKINITSSKVGKHTIDLSTQFSKSYKKQTPENKWSFLRPECKFLDLSGNVIDSIDTEDCEIKINQYGKIDNINGITVGISGTAYFYLVDDIYNMDYVANRQPYTTIIATLQTSAVRSFHDSFNLDENLPSNSNSLASVVMPHNFIWRYPDHIDISENGIVGYVKNRWSKAKHPFIAKYAFDENAYFDDKIGNGVKIYNPNLSFCKYIPFNDSYSETLNVNVLGISSNIYPQPFEINYLDSDTGFKTAGYYKGQYTVDTTSATNVSISVDSTIRTPLSLSSNFHNPILWISNPEAGMAASVQYFHEDWIFDISNKNLNKAHVKVFDIPIIKMVSPTLFFADNNPLSGFHGVYSIAALPAPQYCAWMCDSETHILYKMSTMGDVLCAVNLKNIFYDRKINFPAYDNSGGVLSPAAIALDSNQNIWVSLYDSMSCIKLDKNGNFSCLASPKGNIKYSTNQTTSAFYNLFLETSDYYPTNADDIKTTYDVNLMEATCLDTDSSDNVWVSYSNILSGLVLKYDTNGTLLNTITYPMCSSPQEIKCDSDDNVWIVGSNFTLNHTLIPPTSSEFITGFLEKRNSRGMLLSSFGPFNGINHLTLDKDENPWFTYSYHWIGNINNKTGEFRKLKIISGGYSDTIPKEWNPNINVTETALEGIGCDLIGNIFVINSIENKLFIIDSDAFKIKDFININPKGFTYSNQDANEKGPTIVSFDYWTKSAQAQGDWTGLRWIKKYGNSKLQYLFNNSDTLILKGEVNNINFNVQNNYDFFKINENHDLADSMHDIAFQPNLRNSEFLFKKFLGSIFGKYPFEHDDLGIESYEKVSNFLQNQSDIDTCNITNLYDISNMVDMGSQDFKISFPSGMDKLIDNLSINKSKLWGSILDDNLNLKTNGGHVNFNRGKKLNTETYYVTAGVPVILKTKSINDFKKIQTGYYYPSNVSLLCAVDVGLFTYPLTNLCEFLNLGENWDSIYEFYEFISSTNKTYIDGIIDWNNEQTVLNSNLSSYLDWIKDEGILDTMFSYQLYKGLGLLT